MAAVSFLGARVQQQPRTVRVQTARAAVCQSAPAPAVGRRALAASLLALPTLLAVRPALALLPDDEDEELLAKAKAGRKDKVVTDKASQRAFVASEGYASPADIAVLQTTVNALSKTGFLLAAGQLDEAKTTAEGPWVGDLKRVAASVGTGAAASASALSAVARLQRSTSLEQAKKDYVAAVGALEEFCTLAGVANKLKGL